jgi:signal transduction histidine kinase
VENSRLYTDARAAIEVRDRFLSIASHELKTPLASSSLMIGGLARLARAGRLESLTNEKLLERFAAIERQTDRLGTLINDLLDVSRINAGRLVLERAPMDLAEMVQEVVNRFEEFAERARCQLTFEAEGSVTGLWDRNRLDQVATNLIVNALKYGAGKPVHVQVRHVDDRALIAVTDHGPGLQEKDRDRIFEQFERAASVNYGGLGLGLWIVRQVVDAHGGQVFVESTVGQGATFTVLLPTAPAPER